MAQTAFSVLLFIHIATGFVALVAGLFSMVAHKGVRLHNASCLLYTSPSPLD